MRITPEQIYDLAGLKVGDKVRIAGYKKKDVGAIYKNSIEFQYSGTKNVGLLFYNEFEKVESKIWNIDEIKRGDFIWFVGFDMEIRHYFYDGSKADVKVIAKNIAFKEEKYAEEYKEKLIEFNEEYKKGCE